MKNATVLIIVGKDISLVDLAKTLESIRDQQARASVVVVDELPALPIYAIGVPPYGISEVPVGWHENRATQQTKLHEKAREIETLLDQHDVSGEVTFVAGEVAMLASALTKKAMFCDMVLVGNDLRGQTPLFHQVVHGVLFESPVGVVLNDTNARALTNAECVFVAWNTQLHSARAVHQALPILRRAKEVVVAIIDPEMAGVGNGEDPGVDIAKWLASHDCNVTLQQYSSGKLSVGESILARSQEVGTDLIVMGAYGHSRVRQSLFGGTSRTLIEQTERAVFLAY